MEKIYLVVFEWSDYGDTDVETSVCKTKEKAIQNVNNYVENDTSVNDLYEYVKEHGFDEDLEYDKESGYFHATDGDNWCSIYIEEKEIEE